MFVFQAIDSIKSPEDFKVIDIMLLLILHSSGYKKLVESACRTKITSGFITEPLLQTVFNCHADVINQFVTLFYCHSFICLHIYYIVLLAEF